MAAGLEELRRSTRAEVPSHRRPAVAGGSRRWRAIVFTILSLGSLGAVGWGAARFLLGDPRFFLATVELHGRRFAAASQIEDKFIADRGRSLLRVPLEERRRAIEQIPWVRSAMLTRVFPARIAVTIEERIPVAFLWTAAGVALIDEGGVILDAPPEGLLAQGIGGQGSFTFPVIRGVSADESEGDRRRKMQLYMAMMNDLDRGDRRLRDEISEVDLSDPQDARAVITDTSGAILLHLGNQDFLSRYLVYASRIGEWKQKFSNVQSVDLRFGGQVVINADPPRTPPTSRPAAGSSSSPPPSR